MSSASTINLRERINEDHLTCTICYNAFEKPRALPCLHTFCEHCIRDFIVSRGFVDQGRFPCPICRQEVKIPDGGVENFPYNHMVTSLSETVSASKRTKPIVPPRPSLAKKAQESLHTGSGEATKESGDTGDILNSEDRQSPSQFNQIQGDMSTDVTTPMGNLYPKLPQLEPESPVQLEPVACSDGLLLKFGKSGPFISDFFKPVGLAVGLHGEYIVSDHGGNRIFVFDSAGNLQSRFTADCSINDVEVTSGNEILVTVKSKSAILRRYAMNGTQLSEYGSHYRFEEAHGVTLMPNGHVAVTGLQNNCIYILTEQFKFSAKFGRKGTGDERFMAPYYIASNTKSNVIVSDWHNSDVQVFNHVGKFKYRFGGKGANHGQLCNPMGVCSDKDNNIIIADSGNYRVEMFAPKGRFFATVVEKTFMIGPDVKPVNVAVTSTNNIVVMLVGKQFVEIRVYSSPASGVAPVQTQFFQSPTNAQSSTCYVQ